VFYHETKGIHQGKGRAAMIKTVIRMRNNQVMAFDADGEQVPGYQGQFGEVRERILRDAPPGTVFNHWFGFALKPRTVPEETW
jgi:hypothetical protein